MIRRVTLLHAACLGLTLVGPGAAFATVPEDGGPKMDAAYQAFDERLAKDRAGGTPPRLSTPDDAEVLRQAWDRAAILGQPPYTAQDTPVLLNVMNEQTLILRTYVFFTPDPNRPPDPDTNSFTFQDEITPSEVFLIDCFGGSMQALGDFAAHPPADQFTDVRRQGLARFRAGLVTFIQGWSQTVASPGLRGGNRAAMVDSMAAAGPVLAAGLPLEDRAAILQSVTPALPKLTADEQAKLQQGLVTPMSSQVCEGFCAVK